MGKGKIGKSVLKSSKPTFGERVIPDKVVSLAVKGLAGDINDILDFAKGLIAEHHLSVKVALEAVAPDKTVVLTVIGAVTDAKELIGLLTDAFGE